jgi:hypothetical protein
VDAGRPTPGDPPGAGAQEIPPPEGSRRVKDSIACEPRPPRAVILRPDGGPHGALDKEDIRAVIRSHVGEVRTCYEQWMIAPPYPKGRVMTRLSIDPNGNVPLSCVVESDLKEPRIDRCIVDTVLKWQFPKPIGGGWVIVDYPFVLVPG